MKRRWHMQPSAALSAVLCLLAALLLSASASAQESGKGKPTAKGKRSEVRVERSRGSADAVDKAKGQGEGQGEDAGSAAATSEEVRTEGDTQVKTMEFSGLDIEGQLKTPQMLYFLNRLRAEFGRPRLPHRSFMPELQRSAKHEALE